MQSWCLTTWRISFGIFYEDYQSSTEGYVICTGRIKYPSPDAEFSEIQSLLKPHLPPSVDGEANQLD